MATADEPDPLERILRTITDAEHLRELTIYMTNQALDTYVEVCKGLTEEELRARVEDGSLREMAHQAANANFDVTMRRWLIMKGYL